MNQLRTRVIAIFLICICIITILAVRYATTVPHRSDVLDIKSRCLLVTVDGPADWVDGHEMFLEWYGQYVSLPVVIEIDDLDTPIGANLGANEPIIMMGQDTFHIISKPSTPCSMRNSANFAFVTQQASNRAERISWVSCVTIAPDDWSGPIPAAADRSNAEPSQSMSTTVTRLIASGKVLHYPHE